MMNTNQAFLILSDSLSETVFNLYSQITLAIGNLGDTLFFYHNKNEEGVISEDLNLITYPFTDRSLAELSYIPIRNTLYLVVTIFPLLKFYLENRCYDYYWLIENNVIFNEIVNTFLINYSCWEIIILTVVTLNTIIVILIGNGGHLRQGRLVIIKKITF